MTTLFQEIVLSIGLQDRLIWRLQIIFYRGMLNLWFMLLKPTTLEALEVNIYRAINEIRSEILEKGVQNWTDYLRLATISRGSHMPEIIFKT